MPYDWTPCEGCYNNYLTVYDTSDGSSFKPVCKSYTCTKHGWRQTKRLRTALEGHFKQYDYIRMWTFTMTNRMHSNTDEHYRSMTRVWQRFITELRRNKLFTKSERGLQYVRVCEQHVSGYWHFHVLVDRWLDAVKAQLFWEHCVQEELKITGHSGTASIKGKKTYKGAAYYVSKYVTKSAFEAFKRQKLWTKSSRLSIYPTKESDRTFITWDSKRKLWLGFNALPDLTCLILSSTYPKKGLIELFPEFCRIE